MCLYAKSTPLVAETDIVCYKVLQSLDGLKREVDWRTLIANKEKGIKYLTPYNYFPMELGETYDCNGKKYNVDYKCDGYVRVGAGFIHTFSNIEEAFRAIGECDMYGAVVVKSIIPKGTRYYEGSMQYEYKNKVSSYASRSFVLGGEDDIIAFTDEEKATKKGEMDDVILNYNGKKYIYKYVGHNLDSIWQWYEVGNDDERLVF